MEYNIEANKRTLCVFGHRAVTLSPDEKTKLYDLLERFITNENVGIFLFGGFGDFDELCRETVTALKEKYPFIARVYRLRRL